MIRASLTDSLPPVGSLGVPLCGALVLAVAVGCMPDIKQDKGAPPERVQPVFDPVSETVPLPNDAALDEQGTLPELEGIDGDDANGEFLSWLATLHGWLPATPIEIPFNGELEKESISKDAVRLYRLTSDGNLESVSIANLEYETTKVAVAGEDDEVRQIDGSRIVVRPKNALETHSEYAVIVTKSIKGAGGKPIVEPQPIFFAASEDPLVDENGEKTVESLPDDATAQQLESLRQLLAPVYAGADAKRSEIAMAFRWSTVKDPRTILDPATSTLPLPNDAALDTAEGHPPEQVGTFPVGGAEGVEVESKDTDGDGEPDQFEHVTTKNTAQAHFNAYLDRLHGWPPPPNTPIQLPIDGAVKPDSVGPGSIEVWRYTLQQNNGETTAKLEEKLDPKKIEYDEQSGTVTVTPKETLPKRNRYLAYATDDIENSDGLSLKLPAALKMAIQPHPVVDEDGNSTVGRLSNDQAQQIDRLRSLLRPPVTALVDKKDDLALDDIGAIWTWQNWTDTFAVFDPPDGPIPFPNSLRHKDSGEINVPTDGLSGIRKEIVEEVNRRFGFSTTAASWIPFDGPVDPSTISKDNVPFVRSTENTTEAYDTARYRLEYKDNWKQLLVHPNEPWNRDSKTDSGKIDSPLTIGAVLKGVKDPQGRPVMPSPAFVFLRSPEPLWDKANGSLVDQLSDDAAKQLEQNRPRFDALIQLAVSGQVKGFEPKERTDLSLGYGFHPENPVQPLQEFRAQALEKLSERGSSSVGRLCQRSNTSNCSSNPGQVPNPGGSYKGPNGMGPAVDMSNVQRIQWAAEFDTVEFLQSDGTMADYSGANEPRVGASVFLPKAGPNCSGPFQVVIAQHGLGSHRVRAGMALANALAAECLATVVMDFPGHGGRAPNSSSLHPDSNPSKSGDGFLSSDLRATKNRLLQSAVDLAVLAQIVQNDRLEAAFDNQPGTDYFAYGSANEIGYVGADLGGLVGLPASTVDSNLTVAVYNATGGGYAEIWSTGNMGGPVVKALNQEGLKKDSFERFRFLSLIQWIMDPVDPVAFAPFVQDDPVAEVSYDAGNSSFSTGNQLSADEVLLQMAQSQGNSDDAQIPNATTKRLAESAGVSVSESTYTAGHRFLFELGAASNSAADCARRQAAAWLASGLNGQASYPNGLKASNCTSN